MANEPLTVTTQDIDKIIKDYNAQRAVSNSIEVQLSGVNNIDTLLLLKIMGKKEPSVDDIAQAAEIMLDGRTITFVKGAETLFTVNYNRGAGNSLHLMFKDCAYLYDILQQTIYALMLKKLTPHLEGSN